MTKHYSISHLVIMLVSLLSTVSAYGFKLPDTGQTKCYDVVSFNEIPCGGTGQDGAYTINPMSFVDNGNGTITDNNTGLMWQKYENASTYNWYQATGTYDATFNPQSQSICSSLDLGGYADWRLPSKKELMTIVEFDTSLPPSINTMYFPDAYPSYYWVSTPCIFYYGFGWYVSFYDGTVSLYNSLGVAWYVRCVRGG